MKVSEDRFPLLYVYLEGEEEKYDARARTMTRGAAEILGNWPHYLTFVSYMSVIGLLSLFVCFVLSALFLSLTAHKPHNPRRFSLVKCGWKEPANHGYHLATFDVGDEENATFIVDVAPTGDSNKCAVESYLKWTTQPVYHIRIASNEENDTILGEIQKKHENYRVVTISGDEFLRGTIFANNPRGRPLSFLIKLLIAWNFGGTVLDANLVSVADYRGSLPSGADNLVVGLIGADNVLISAGRVCHAFVFDLMKYMTREGNGSKSPAEIVRDVERDFCSPGRNCSTIHVISEPCFCESQTAGCIFAKHWNNTSPHWDKICPLTKFLT